MRLKWTIQTNQISPINRPLSGTKCPARSPNAYVCTQPLVYTSAKIIGITRYNETGNKLDLSIILYKTTLYISIVGVYVLVIDKQLSLILVEGLYTKQTNFKPCRLRHKMEETKKYYSQRTITIATYFGGPLAAGYLVKKNYETLGQPHNARKSLLIGIVSTILIFAGIFSIPEEIVDKIPNALIPLIYTGIIYLIVERIQGESLKNHKESGGEFYSGWKAAGVGAIALLIIALTAFIAGDLSNTQPNFDAIAYDKEVAKFVDNENKSVAVFNVIDTQTPDYLIKEFSKGIVMWKENKRIVEGLNSIENLPKILKDQNTLLLKYCDLRIQHNEIILKAISEDTDKYVSEIERIGFKINKILEDLKISQPNK
ncbi:hypothetical protein SAMN05216323_11243 [Williamwhitmania taraxaci]|uniref:Uncharacterized protein n=2 Tax=Williamwhitmania taraxaci TaxID=1640674 RepID=A0A1G6TK89_9BACT|nr:hypothetical protein SAMN05216323_11243 [Williamwhitmania taraxaci]